MRAKTQKKKSLPRSDRWWWQPHLTLKYIGLFIYNTVLKWMIIRSYGLFNPLIGHLKCIPLSLVLNICKCSLWIRSNNSIVTRRSWSLHGDCGVFQAWAVFKGKFKEGDKAEPATWKTRLRCALNKSPDFEEVTDRSQLDISEPYKVYRIVPEEEQKCKCLRSYYFSHTEGVWANYYLFFFFFK